MSAAFDAIDDSGILTPMGSAPNPDAPGPASETWVDVQPTSVCEASACTLGLIATTNPILPEAQLRWAARPLVERLQPFRKARHWIATHPEAFARAISPQLARSQADTLVTELLPLLDAIRFLERNAQRLLAPVRLGRRGRPLWLAGVQAELHHEPLGHVLVIGPANFPLFLPGVQVLQALVAGNAVTWKPGAGGGAVARLLAHILREAGLPRGVLRVTDETVEAAQRALDTKPQKVVFTGSVNTGKGVLKILAESVTPSTMELSGTDAVIVLPSADLSVTAQAIAFGLRLNGAEVCMSPRRLVATRETLEALRPALQRELDRVPGIVLKPQTAQLLNDLVRDAQQSGAKLSGNIQPAEQKPLLIDHAKPTMAITRTDIFAPVLSLLEAPTVLSFASVVNDNPYGLTAAIFGDLREAQTLAGQLRVGTVVINDLIAPTADPRVPFGGRGQSGYGQTRGAEGLLGMTTTKTILMRRKGSTRHYEPLSDSDLPLFSGLIGTLHGGTLGRRWQAFKQLSKAARSKRTKNKN